MPTMFDFARPVLKNAGLKVGADWDETKSLTLRSTARAQLARRNIRPETAARWNRRTYLVSADIGTDARLDPRVTAVHNARK